MRKKQVMPNTENWSEEFDEKFVDKEGCQAGHSTQPDCEYCKRWGGAEGEPKYHKRPTADAGKIKSFIKEKLIAAHNEGRGEGQQEERQFIFNVLDGIDKADEQMQNKGGGTRAIRFALSSRYIPPSPNKDKV